jgi:hypothetical protein
MKGEIYQSDIEFALREINAGHADEVIVAALGKRGIEATRAGQLICDLRTGKPVSSYQPPWPKQWRPEAPPAETPTRPPAEKRPHRPPRAKTPVWIWILALLCVGLVVALVIHGARDSGSADTLSTDEQVDQTNAPASGAN